jgi:signal peptidase I
MAQHDFQSADSVEPSSDVRTAPPQKSAASGVGRALREIIETLVLAGIIFLAVRMVVLNFRVDGDSMLPNMHNEEMLLVNRNAYASLDLGPIGEVLPGSDDAADDDRFYPFDPPQRGDVIVFNPPTNSNKPYIKRVIGLPGEQVTFRGGSVFINGIELDEPYIEDATRCGGNSQCDLVVEPDSVFVLGDNRENSSDSRVFGAVPVDRIIGKAWVTYWPPSDLGFVPHEDYPGLPETPMADADRSRVPVVDASPGSADDERERPRRDRERRNRNTTVVGTPAP